MRATIDPSQVVARLYEGVFDERAFEEAVSDFASLVGGYSGLILFKDQRLQRHLVLAEAGEVNDTSAYLNHYRSINPFEALFGGRPEGQLFAPGPLAFTSDYQNSEFFVDWASRRGYGDFLGCHILRRSREYAWLSIRRAVNRGPFEARQITTAKRLIPHVQRAVNLWAEVRASRALHSCLESALQLLSMAVILVDNNGEIVWANRSAEAGFVHDGGLRSQRGRVAAPTYRDTERLREMIREQAAPVDASEFTGGADLVLSTGDGARPLTVHIVRLSHREQFPSRAVVALFSVDSEKGVGSIAPFCAAYGLTAAEGRVLAELVAGKKIGIVGRRLGISEWTARTHLKHIMLKTGTKRQAEIMRLFFTSCLPPFNVGMPPLLPRRSDQGPR
jgi:DNA-binding CsgD family transcriptional regulator